VSTFSESVYVMGALVVVHVEPPRDLLEEHSLIRQPLHVVRQALVEGRSPRA
jgi:hypothetical protein